MGTGDSTIKESLEAPVGAEISQNQRLALELMKKYSPTPPQLNFCSGSSDYGKHLAPIKATDDNLWRDISAPLAVKASFDGSSDLSVTRRTFLQLRSIRRAGIPFISAAPVGDSLNKILASIEGPPDTPYAGGIFWIAITIPELDCRPPLVRFQTRIYHPNIDCHGNVCADYAEWWNDPSLRVYMKAITQEYNAAWFSERRSNHFSLGTVLTALCSLLASPNIDDPLVPEIAEKYLGDYSGYCEAARLYTEKYATGQRPSDEELVFKEDTIDNAYQPSQFVPTQKGSSNTSSYLDTPAATLSRTSTNTGDSTLSSQSTLAPTPDSERMTEELKIHMGLVLDPFFKSPSEPTTSEPSSALVNEPPPPGFLKSMFLLPENKRISERSDALPSDYGWEEASSFLFFSHGRNDVPLGRLVSSASDVGLAQPPILPTIFQDMQSARTEGY
jgi:ubiquitin-protein ligase